MNGKTAKLFRKAFPVREEYQVAKALWKGTPRNRRFRFRAALHILEGTRERARS